MKRGVYQGRIEGCPLGGRGCPRAQAMGAPLSARPQRGGRAPNECGRSGTPGAHVRRAESLWAAPGQRGKAVTEKTQDVERSGKRRRDREKGPFSPISRSPNASPTVFEEPCRSGLHVLLGPSGNVQGRARPGRGGREPPGSEVAQRGRGGRQGGDLGSLTSRRKRTWEGISPRPKTIQQLSDLGDSGGRTPKVVAQKSQRGHAPRRTHETPRRPRDLVQDPETGQNRVMEPAGSAQPERLRKRRPGEGLHSVIQKDDVGRVWREGGDVSVPELGPPPGRAMGGNGRARACAKFTQGFAP